MEDKVYKYYQWEHKNMAFFQNYISSFFLLFVDRSSND